MSLFSSKFTLHPEECQTKVGVKIFKIKWKPFWDGEWYCFVDIKIKFHQVLLLRLRSHAVFHNSEACIWRMLEMWKWFEIRHNFLSGIGSLSMYQLWEFTSSKNYYLKKVLEKIAKILWNSLEITYDWVLFSVKL